MIVPVYRSEIFLWNPDHGPEPWSSKPWFTKHSFEPIPDYERWHESTRHRRLGGMQPTWFLAALGGELFILGSVYGPRTYLRTVSHAVLHPSRALELARINDRDLKFHDPKTPRVMSVAVREPSQLPSGPAFQAFLF